MTDGITLPRKVNVNVVISIHLNLNISKSVRLQWNTYGKSCMANGIVTCVTTSRDSERSRSRPRYLWGLISRKQFKIAGRCQWSTYRKSHRPSRSRMVTSPMMLSDLQRSRLWLRYIYPYYLEILVRQAFYFGILGVLSNFFGVIYAHMPTNRNLR